MFPWHFAMLEQASWASIDCGVNTLPLISTTDYKLYSLAEHTHSATGTAKTHSSSAEQLQEHN